MPVDVKTKQPEGNSLFNSENCRYVELIRLHIPLCALASLNWVSHGVPAQFPCTMVSNVAVTKQIHTIDRAFVITDCTHTRL